MSTKLEYILGAVVLVMALFLGYEQYHKAIDNAKAETKAEADKQNIAERNSALKARDEQNQAQMADMQKRMDLALKMNSAQIAAKAQQYIPSLPDAVHAVTTEEAKQTPQLHEGDLIVPKSDVQPLAKNQLDFEVCKLDRVKCQADLGDWQRKYELADDEGKQWKKAARGGSIFKRAGKAALMVAIGAGVGYALHR